MTSLRNYIEELTEKVAEAKQAGQTVDEVQQRITVASLSHSSPTATHSSLPVPARR